MFSRSSLRFWLLIVSILFAMAVVGGISITTYFIVADGMQGVAQATTQRIGNSAATIVRDAVSEAELTAGAQGFAGTQRAQLALQNVRDKLPSLLNSPGLSEAEYALYDSRGGELWSSSPSALWPGQGEARQRATLSGTSTISTGRVDSMLSGLVRKAQLTIHVLHIPVKMPDGTTAVLDVTYRPDNEERVIDAVRAPMVALALSAMMIMVLLMQTSMAWVLSLVANLRKAADSIESGQLDARLPEHGSNEISSLAHSINRLIERLQRRNEAQARFVADASHELATPVAGIRGYTSILRAWGAEDPKVRDEAVDAIDRESRRMARLTGDLLNLLHADQGLVLKTERFNVNVLVRDRLAATASRWIDKDIDFVGPEEEEPLVMSGDPDRFEDVVSILLDNAAKYTPAGGRVVASTRRRREMIELDICDTGQGIPPDDLPRIFDRFFRSEASRAAGEGGFGLGLAICKSIVDSMGGTIDVSSEVDRGTMFRVRVPRGRM
ncbi:MAG TPA: HAMP domain-containing sensor histidine kinase [Coriobacteriia bacterium]